MLYLMTKPIQPLNISEMMRRQLDTLPNPATLALPSIPDISAAIKAIDDQVSIALKAMPDLTALVAIASAQVPDVFAALKADIESATRLFDVASSMELPRAYDFASHAAHTVPPIDVSAPLRRVRELEQRLADVEAELRLIRPLPDAEDLN